MVFGGKKGCLVPFGVRCGARVVYGGGSGIDLL